MKRVVYIAHRLNAASREGIEANREAAAHWVGWLAANFDIAPVADWIVLTGVWPETMRAHGLAIDLRLIERCDEVWLVGPVFSAGMRLEAEHARACAIPVYDLTGATCGGIPVVGKDGPTAQAIRAEVARIVGLQPREVA